MKMKPNSKSEVISPVSIVSSLNLVLLGAKGTTYDEILSTLGYNESTSLFENSSKIHESFSSLIENINNPSTTQFTSENTSWKNVNVSEVYRSGQYKNESGNSKTSIVNGIFVQEGRGLRNSYVMAAKNLYKCETKNLDFATSPAQSARYINDWVNNETKGLVRNIVGESLDTATKLIIVNSLYFKADWFKEFIDGATDMKNFYPNGLENPAISVEMMANAGHFPYGESRDLDCRILGLPYKDKQTTMYIIIPNNSNKSKLEKLQADLSFDKLETLIDQMTVKTAIILLPKMSLTNQYNLRDILEGMGVKSLFSPRTSDLSLISEPEINYSQTRQTEGLYNQLVFSRLRDELNVSNKKKREVTNNAYLESLERLRQMDLSNPGLFASDVLHKIKLIVNEQGTEAGAATAVTINRSGPQVFFRVEVPFLVVIRHDSTKLPLFYGSVFEPST
ncbi:serine protease inhibitor 28Dc isoform X2 [Culicoides brevitarsis]